MPECRSAEEWAKIAQRHVKVEDVIFDGPVCRTCRYINGSAVQYPCDAALILQETAALIDEKIHAAILVTDLRAKRDVLQQRVEGLEAALRGLLTYGNNLAKVTAEAALRGGESESLL